MARTQDGSPGGLRAAVTLGMAGFLLLAGLGRPGAAPPAAGPSPVRLDDLRLKDPSGRGRSLTEYREAKVLVLVFLGTSCPISNSYAEALTGLGAGFSGRGVQLVGINSMREEDLKAVARHASEYRLGFPVFKDERQAAADRLGARVTPEAFVLDDRRVLRYRGRIDDGYASRTKRRSVVGSHDLRDAVEALLAGRAVAAPETQAFGCAIARPEKARSARARVTYHRDVAPILQAQCQSCHRPGQIGPFPLMSYSDARSWAAEIRELTRLRQMPPWQAEPGHGDFLDVRRLTDEEIATLAAWSDEGAPEGRREDAPPPKQWPDGWTLGKPDLVLSMPEPYHVSATGPDEFRCFVLPTGLTEDQQVVAVEIRPGNPRVAHHVLNFIDTSGRGRELDARDPGPGYSSGPGGIGFLPAGGVGGWAPGNLPRFLPPGVGRPLPRGSDLVMQMHYHKTGRPEVDQTTIGLYFAREPITRRVRVWPLTNLIIDIPPGEPRYERRANLTLPFAVEVLTITPHMHLLGKEMKVTATLPDGAEKSLVWVRDWDYRWQDSYRYRAPLALPKGTRIEMVAYFDNSPANPRNPNSPPKRVRFGEQTTDEMCFAFIEYTLEQEPALRPLLRGLFGAP